MTWLNGYGQQPRRQTRPPAARTPDKTWTKGKTRATALVACCPECGSRYVRIRTPTSDQTVIFECKECGKEWDDERCDRLA